jgi:hypothetical protein
MNTQEANGKVSLGYSYRFGGRGDGPGEAMSLPGLRR